MISIIRNLKRRKNRLSKKHLNPKTNPFIRTNWDDLMAENDLFKNKSGNWRGAANADDTSRRMKRYWKLWKKSGNTGRLFIGKIAIKREAI